MHMLLWKTEVRNKTPNWYNNDVSLVFVYEFVIDKTDKCYWEEVMYGRRLQIVITLMVLKFLSTKMLLTKLSNGKEKKRCTEEDCKMLSNWLLVKSMYTYVWDKATLRHEQRYCAFVGFKTQNRLRCYSFILSFLKECAVSNS